MTSDPAAPNAAAVYLYYENIVDDKEHFHKIYAEVKILTEKGKEDFSEIEIPYETGEAEINVNEVRGQTIEPDGTVVPFTGKPYQKMLLKTGDEKVMEKVFSLPDVRVGSVIEYQYAISYDGGYFVPPEWMVQGKYFIHEGHYHFVPTDTHNTIVSTDSLGHENAVNHLIYFQSLPAGMQVREGLDGFDLVVNNIPALPEEPYTPPLDSFSYRVLFYYSPYDTSQEFWKAEGKYWSKDVNRFADVSDRIKSAVAQIVSPADTDQQKLQKIYAAVMTVENTDFTREHTQQENKVEGQKMKTAADIWANKRGDSTEITRLFIAMARAAGLKAYDMAVTQRNQSILNLGYLSWGDQLSDEIAIVNVNGKDQYFDPGERYCEFGKLDWVHQQMMGIRQTDDGTQVAEVPSGAYTDNATLRTGDLTLAADGAVQGQIRIAMTGVEALRWRQYALSHDEEATKKAFEKEVQERVPAGVQVKMNHFLGLTDSTTNLMAILDVSGNMGTATGKRVFVPASFFEASEKPLFPAEQRENPIDLHFPFIARDEITLTLAPGLSVDSVPSNASIPYPQMADYQTAYGGKGTIYKQVRLLALANTIYKTTEYPQLRTFFQKIGAQDQQQLVLDRVAVAAGTAAPASGPGAK